MPGDRRDLMRGAAGLRETLRRRLSARNDGSPFRAVKKACPWA